ncbi:MAG: response regulator transcription factor [Spirochaetales bacterium]|nr:response regulator transcription factor [Spirochaetales bacterium]
MPLLSRKCIINVTIAGITLKYLRAHVFLCYLLDMFYVAVVDDEKELLYSLKIILEAEGWEISVFTDSVSALASFKERLPDVIIMDIMMPGEDGLWLCGRVREIAKTVPIIFLSAKVEEIDKVVGLESGADDYLGKPFSARELIARIRVQKRRLEALNGNQSESRPELVLDGFTLERGTMSLSFRAKNTPLTVSEYRILKLVMNRNKTICTREELLNAVYQEDTYVCDRVIDNHIKRIRDKIQKLVGQDINIIETVYGVGYRWSSL